MEIYPTELERNVFPTKPHLSQITKTRARWWYSGEHSCLPDHQNASHTTQQKAKLAEVPEWKKSGVSKLWLKYLPFANFTNAREPLVRHSPRVLEAVSASE